jgi:hypothetical protein
VENLVSDPDASGAHLKSWNLDGGLTLATSVQAGTGACRDSILALSGSRAVFPARGLPPGMNSGFSMPAGAGRRSHFPPAKEISMEEDCDDA